MLAEQPDLSTLLQSTVTPFREHLSSLLLCSSLWLATELLGGYEMMASVVTIFALKSYCNQLLGFFTLILFRVQVRLRTEVPSTPSLNRPGFKLMTSRS